MFSAEQEVTKGTRLSNSTQRDYKFHEIAALTDIKPYVLRFWESEFPEISPSLDQSGVKSYSYQDLETIKKIKSLLFHEKLSIPQAKMRLSEASVLSVEEQVDVPALPQQVSVKKHLQGMLSSIERIKRSRGW